MKEGVVTQIERQKTKTRMILFNDSLLLIPKKEEEMKPEDFNFVLLEGASVKRIDIKNGFLIKVVYINLVFECHSEKEKNDWIDLIYSNIEKLKNNLNRKSPRNNPYSRNSGSEVFYFFYFIFSFVLNLFYF